VALKAKAVGRQREGIAIPSGCFHEAFVALKAKAGEGSGKAGEGRF